MMSKTLYPNRALPYTICEKDHRFLCIICEPRRHVVMKKGDRVGKVGKVMFQWKLCSKHAKEFIEKCEG